MTACHPALFEYPDRAALGRVVPKSRIYVAGKANRRLKERFASQIERIIWQYKLAPESLNLRGSEAVPEIQLFRLELKPGADSETLPEDILRCIDKAIGFPLIFELITSPRSGNGGKVRVAATYKRPSEADASKWVLGEYFATGWMPADTPRAPLPVALDLPRLYDQLLRALIPVPSRKGETLAELTERHNQIVARQRECQRLEARIHREKQFNRKVELNRQLRELKAELKALSESTNEGQRQHG